MSTATHGYSNLKMFGRPNFTSVHNIGSSKTGSNVIQKSLAEVTALPQAIVSVTARNKAQELVIEITGHGAKIGDVCRIYSGAAARNEYDIIEVIDANRFVIHNVDTAPAAADTAKILFYVTSKSDSEGNVNFSPGPTQFVHNGSTSQVTQDDAVPANNRPLPAGLYFYKDGAIIPVRRDTVTPANNAPMPVELIGFDGGTININAGDIGIQLSDLGATFDASRIGDGSGVYLKIEADGSININSADILAELQTLVTEVQGLAHAQGTDGAASTAEMLRIGGTDGTNDQILKMTAGGRAEVEVMASVLPTGASTEAKQDDAIAELTDINTATTELADTVGVDGTPGPAKGLLIGGIDSNGDFQRASVNPAGEILVNIAAGGAGIASEATLDALNDKFSNDFGASATGIRTAAQLGNAAGAADFNSGADTAQTLRVSANLKRAGNELSYGLGASDANTLRMMPATDSGLATGVKQDELKAELVLIKGDVEGITDKFGTLGQKASAGSAPMVLSTEQEAILERIADATEAATGAAAALSSHQTQAVVANTLFTAPVGAKRMIVQNSLIGGAIRFVPAAQTPTAADGFYLGTGQSTSEMAAGSFRAIAVDGAEAGDVTVLWIV